MYAFKKKGFWNIFQSEVHKYTNSVTHVNIRDVSETKLNATISLVVPVRPCQWNITLIFKAQSMLCVCIRNIIWHLVTCAVMIHVLLWQVYLPLFGIFNAIYACSFNLLCIQLRSFRHKLIYIRMGYSSWISCYSRFSLKRLGMLH